MAGRYLHLTVAGAFFAGIVAAQEPAAEKFWVSFGDSYTQTWFNVTDVQPNRENPLGNPQYPGFSACGHKHSWPTQVTGILNSTFVAVYNHAFGGAVTDKNLVTPWKPDVKDLIEEVDDFLAWNAPDKRFFPGWTSDNTLFAWWMGINDIGNSFWLEGDRDVFSGVLLDKYFELVEKVVAVGAKHFLFLNIPPIERSPLQLINANAESRALEKKVIAGYNKQLAERVEKLKADHEGVTAILFDVDALLNKILDNPADHGFTTNATAYGDGDEQIWCNDYHLSETAHWEIAQAIANITRGTFT